MNILYLCTYYHRAMIFRDAMDYLEKRNNNVTAFNAALHGEAIAEKYKSIMDNKVIHRECYRNIDRYFYFRKQNKIYKSLIDNLKASQFDMIHSHFLFNGGWVARRIKKEFGIPYVISVRSGDINGFLKIPFFKYIARIIIRDAAGVLFLSDAYKDALIKRCYKEKEKNSLLEKSTTIPNGLEEFWLANRGIPKHFIGKKIRILSIGKIDRNKNMKSVVLAAERLKEQGWIVEVTIIGQVIENEIKEFLDSSEMVSIIPYQKKEDLIHYYRENDIFVLPSFYETFGRVYAEAMSQGLPVVYTRGQGFDGIFEEGRIGYSVDAHDVDEIADAIVKICKNYDVMSQACIDECVAFDWNLIAEKLEKFYMSSKNGGGC